MQTCILTVVIGVNTRAESAQIIQLFVSRLIQAATVDDTRLNGEVSLSIGSSTPEFRQNYFVRIVIVVGFHVKVHRFAVRSNFAVSVELVVTLVTHGSHHDTTLTTQLTHVLVVRSATVVRTDNGTETHVNNPGLSVFLGIILDRLSLSLYGSISEF